MLFDSKFSAAEEFAVVRLQLVKMQSVTHIAAIIQTLLTNHFYSTKYYYLALYE